MSSLDNRCTSTHFSAWPSSPRGSRVETVSTPAIITGGDSGIGRAVALIYALEGADVGIIYHSHDDDAEVTRAAVEQAGRRCTLRKGDVGDGETLDVLRIDAI